MKINVKYNKIKKIQKWEVKDMVNVVIGIVEKQGKILLIKR